MGSFSEFCVCVTDLEDAETQGEEAIPHPLPCPIDGSPDSLPGAAMYRKGGGFGAGPTDPLLTPSRRTGPEESISRKFGAAGRNSAASWARGAMHGARLSGWPRGESGLGPWQSAPLAG